MKVEIARMDTGTPVHHYHIEGELPYVKMVGPLPLSPLNVEPSWEIHFNEYELSREAHAIKVWVPESHRSLSSWGDTIIIQETGHYEFHIWDIYRRK